MVLLKKWSLRIIAGLVIFSIAVLMTAPAQLMENQLTSRVPGLEVRGTSGGFWSGQFQQLVYQGKQFNNLSWNLSVLPLFTARVAADLSLDDPLFKGDLSATQGFSETRLWDINGHQSVSALASLWPPLQMFRPEGELVWDNVTVALNEQKFTEAKGMVQWKNASLNFNGEQFPLKTLNMILTTDNGDLLVTLSDDSMFDLQGTLRISRNNQYQLTASISQDLPRNIRNMAMLLARSDGNGRLVINIPGRW